jgi:hypothetical protein
LNGCDALTEIAAGDDDVGSSRRHRPGRLRPAPSSERSSRFLHTAFEIGEMLLQLLEHETKRKQALDLAD